MNLMHKKQVSIIFTLALLIILFLPLSSASNQYHLKLLAVQENEGNYTGSDADLYLEIKEGSGRVFLDTFPLTKMDTQVSTRFAKEVACNHFKLDCSSYDFIYTIKANSNIIGGPSAGAAITALTVIAVMNLEYDPSITLTGTINSGGIIGPVGGVKEKLEAASKSGIKKVLIAKGNSKQPIDNIEILEEQNINNKTENKSNQTKQYLDLINYSKENLSLEVIEVMDIDEVVYELTGMKFNPENISFSENEEYVNIMYKLMNILCNRTKDINEKIEDNKINLTEEIINASKDKRKSMNLSLEKKDYYSAASFCFSENILLKSYYYQQKNYSSKKLFDLTTQIENRTNLLEKRIKEEKIETISDLQALMIVLERIKEVNEQIKIIKEELNVSSERIVLPIEDLKNISKNISINNSSTETIINKNDIDKEKVSYLLAYAEERYFSAVSWMQFFSMGGKKFNLNTAALTESCLMKIAEAEERYQYAEIYTGPVMIKGIKEKIDTAKESSSKNQPELCLVDAAQAKADADAILSSIGISEDNFNDFFNSKNKAVQRVISENSEEKIFPIMGYSYYQYANSLKEQDKYSALVYLEYALEMSDLSIYFPDDKSTLEKINPKLKDGLQWWLFLEGLVIGITTTALVFIIKRRWFNKPQQLEFVKK